MHSELLWQIDEHSYAPPALEKHDAPYGPTPVPLWQHSDVVVQEPPGAVQQYVLGAHTDPAPPASAAQQPLEQSEAETHLAWQVAGDPLEPAQIAPKA